MWQAAIVAVTILDVSNLADDWSQRCRCSATQCLGKVIALLSECSLLHSVWHPAKARNARPDMHVCDLSVRVFERES